MPIIVVTPFGGHPQSLGSVPGRIVDIDGQDLLCLQAALRRGEVGQGIHLVLWTPLECPDPLEVVAGCPQQRDLSEVALQMLGDRSRQLGEVVELGAVDEIGQEPFEGGRVLSGCARSEGEGALVGALAGQGGCLADRLVPRGGHTDHPSLGLRDIEIGEHVQVVEVLHTFCAHFSAGLGRVSDDRFDEGGFHRLGLDPGHQRPVELDDVRRQREHPLQSGVALANVIYCDSSSSVAQRSEDQADVLRRPRRPHSR